MSKSSIGIKLTGGGRDIRIESRRLNTILSGGLSTSSTWSKRHLGLPGLPLCDRVMNPGF